MDEQNYFQLLGREIRKLAASTDNASQLILDIYHPRSTQPEKSADLADVANKVETLRMMALKVIFKAHKRGPIHNYIQLGEKIWFGERLDVEKKLDNIIDIDVSLVDLYIDFALSFASSHPIPQSTE